MIYSMETFTLFIYTDPMFNTTLELAMADFILFL
jgi:hypothetical protein